MREDRSAKVFVRCELEHQTARAYLIRDEMGTEHWVPKSQADKVNGGMMVAEWLIDKNDIYTGNAAENPGAPDTPDSLTDNDDPGPSESDYRRDWNGDDDIPF